MGMRFSDGEGNTIRGRWWDGGDGRKHSRSLGLGGRHGWVVRLVWGRSTYTWDPKRYSCIQAAAGKTDR
jgi:hypothetical protein